MNTTPLQDVHNALGARWMDVDGARVVADYGDPVAAHSMVRTCGGLIDRSYRGKVRVTGPDRADLLQSMTTNDVAKQAENSAIHNAICTGHGKVQSLFHCLRFGDHYLLDMDPALTEFTASFLDKYTIIREAQTQVVDLAHLAVYGPQSPQVVAGGMSVSASELPDSVGDVKTFGDMIVIAADGHGATGFELLCPPDRVVDLWGVLLASGESHGVGPFGFATLETLRIEQGRARYGVEVDDSIILLEAGFEDTAAFDKGCYVGQETLSRIKFRGQVNRTLRGLLLDGNTLPQAGTELMADDKVVGVLKSAVFSPSLGRPVALAYVKRSHWDAGTEVTVGDLRAEVAELPLYRGE